MSSPNQQLHQRRGYPPHPGYNPQQNPQAGGYGDPQPGVFGAQPPHQIQQQQQQQQQNHGNGQNGGFQPQQPQPVAGQHPQQYPQAQPATGQVMVTSGVPPMLVYVNDQCDVYYLARYDTLSIVILCVAPFVFAVSVIYLIAGVVTWWTGGLLAGSVFSIVFLSWHTRERKILFEHDDKVARIAEKRLFQHFGRGTTFDQVNYRQLGGAGFTGGPGVVGDFYIDMGDTRILLGQRMYPTDMQIASEVEPWRAYLARLRDSDGGPGEGGAPAVTPLPETGGS